MTTLAPPPDGILVDGSLEAATYARVSSATQAEGYSLDTQVAGELQRAGELGWRVREVNVIRETHTGEELFERPELTRLRQKVARGEVRGVIFFDVDRFARDPVWIEMVVQECIHFGAEVAFVRGSDDLGHDTPEARIMRMLKGYAAQVELSQIKERTARGRRARVELQGYLRPSSRGPLYGYRFVDAEQPAPGKRRAAPKVRYVVDDEQAAVVRDIFAQCLSGATIRGIARDLVAGGVSGPTGNGWSPEMVKKILNDASYYGEAYANRETVIKERVDGVMRKRKVPRPREEWIRYSDGVVPAIIDQQTFEAASTVRSTNKRMAARNLTNPEQFLLRGGYVWCGECGDRLYIRNETPSRPNHPVYKCTSRKHDEEGSGRRLTIRADWLDAQVWERIIGLLENPTHLQEEIKRMRANDPTMADLAAIDRQTLQVKRTIANLTKGIASVKTDQARAILTEQLDGTAAQLERLAEERTAVQARRDNWLEGERRATQVQAALQQLRGSAQDMTYELKRKALLALDIKVTLYSAKAAGPRWKMTGNLPFDSTPIGSRTHKYVFLEWSSATPGLVAPASDPMSVSVA